MRGHAQVGREVGRTDEVGALQGESGKRVVVGGLRYGDGHTGLNGEDRVEGPSADDGIGEAG